MVEFLVRNKIILAFFAIWYFVGSMSVPAFFLVGGASVILFWRKKQYFEILLGFFFILILSDNLKYTTDFAKVFKNLYILLLTAIAIFDRSHLKITNNVFKHFIPFLAIATVGLALSPQVFTAFQKQLSYGLILFTIPIFLVSAFKERGPVVIKDLIFLATLMILVGFAMRYIDSGVAYSHGGRFRGIFGNPNGLGVFCSLLFAFAMVAREYFPGLFSKNDLRWIFIPLALAVLWSGSRTALIGITLFYVFSKFYKVHPGLGFIGFVGAAIGAELVSANLVSIVQGLGLSEYMRVETLEDGSGRYIAWNFAWENIQSHFWFGRGFSFDEWLMSSFKDFLSELGHQGGVHNTYLIIWLNTGIVGLLLFLRGYLLLFLKGAKNTRFAFPVFYLVLFGIMLEPWLAASLNPFTIILLFTLTMMTEKAFQPYIRRELNSTHIPNEETPVLA